MAIRSDSYGSVSEVEAYITYALEGNVSLDETTRPRKTQVEKFIDRASGILNSSLSKYGLTTPITNTTAKLACDDWVVHRAVMYAELTQRGTGYSDAEASRTSQFRNLSKDADEFAKMHALGFKYLGVSVSHKASDGLQFTGLDAVDQRSDPDDTSLAQPKFTRGLFDDPSGSGRFSADDEDDE